MPAARSLARGDALSEEHRVLDEGQMAEQAEQVRVLRQRRRAHLRFGSAVDLRGDRGPEVVERSAQDFGLAVPGPGWRGVAAAVVVWGAGHGGLLAFEGIRLWVRRCGGRGGRGWQPRWCARPGRWRSGGVCRPARPSTWPVQTDVRGDFPEGSGSGCRGPDVDGDDVPLPAGEPQSVTAVAASEVQRVTGRLVRRRPGKAAARPWSAGLRTGSVDVVPERGRIGGAHSRPLGVGVPLSLAGRLAMWRPCQPVTAEQLSGEPKRPSRPVRNRRGAGEKRMRRRTGPRGPGTRPTPSWACQQRLQGLRRGRTAPYEGGA